MATAATCDRRGDPLNAGESRVTEILGGHGDRLCREEYGRMTLKHLTNSLSALAIVVAFLMFGAPAAPIADLALPTTGDAFADHHDHDRERDADGDSIPDVFDGCPDLFATTADGCPGDVDLHAPPDAPSDPDAPPPSPPDDSNTGANCPDPNATACNDRGGSIGCIAGYSVDTSTPAAEDRRSRKLAECRAGCRWDTFSCVSEEACQTIERIRDTAMEYVCVGLASAAAGLVGGAICIASVPVTAGLTTKLVCSAAMSGVTGVVVYAIDFCERYLRSER